MTTPVDTLVTAPLVDPIDAKDYKRFWPAHPGYPDYVSVRVPLSRLLWFGVIFLAFCLSALADLILQPFATGPLPTSFHILVIAGFSLLGFPVLARFWERLDVKAELVYRLARFAQANSLGYSPGRASKIVNDPLLGLIFTIPDATSTIISQMLGAATPVAFRTGFCDVKLPAGSRGEIAHWTFLEVRLDRDLPHVVLDSRFNGTKQLPTQFRGSQELKLEGDFDKWFRAYALSPKAADALYVLSPDVMAALIDNAAQADVEVVGNRLYFYFPHQVDVLDPAWWQWVETTVATIGSRLQRTSSHASFQPSEVRRDPVRYRNRWIRRFLRVAGVLVLAVAAVLLANALR